MENMCKNCIFECSKKSEHNENLLCRRICLKRGNAMAAPESGFIFCGHITHFKASNGINH